MKRWNWAWLVAFVAAILVFLPHSTGQELLRDSDTAVLLQKIRERNDPMSWFRGDWPLENHFYRPISTLPFEIDNRLYGDNAAGYGATNALICSLCVLLTFWFLREFTDRPGLATLATVIFAMWNIGPSPFYLSTVITWLMGAVLIVGAIRHRKDWRAYVPVALLLIAIDYELSHAASIASRTVHWLPGRTATTMTIFCLVAMATYARYERLGAKRTVPDPGPLDPPATRSSSIEVQKSPWGWAIVAVASVSLALGSYEQAVMLPAALLGIALTMRWRGYAVRWGWQAPFWTLLVGYLVLRQVILPHTASRYQLQQFRSGPGVFLSLSDYVLPSLGTLPSFIGSLDSGFLLLLTAAPFVFLLGWVRDVNTVVQSRRRWQLALAGYLLSVLTYLPMAWLKQFEHYHYWPLAMRSLFLAVLIGIAGEGVVSAWSPRGRSTPPRPRPAPGSLPRP